MDFSTKENYDKLTKNISRVLYRLGISDDPSDFAQEYVLGVLEGKHRHQTIKQFVIDVLRKRSGRKGSVGYVERSNLSTPGNIDDIQVSARGVSSDDLDVRIHRDRNRRFIKGRMFELYSEGYSIKEIGDLYGVSESRVYQKLKIEKKRIKVIEFIDALKISSATADWAKANL